MATSKPQAKDSKPLAETADGLRLQIDLLDQLLRAGRTEWALETLAEIRRLADVTGVSVVPVTQAEPAKPARRKWVPATPGQVKGVLNKLLASRPPVKSDGPIVVLSFNGHLLNEEKARTYLDAYVELFHRAHIVMVQESNVDALRIIAKACRYGLNASHRNTREQACGILFHPRFQWLGDAPVYHDYLLEVPGHPEFKVTLRPALQRRVKDMATGLIVDLTNFHGKSNVGGPDETRPIRAHQFGQLVEEFTRQLDKSPYQPRKRAGKEGGEGESEPKTSAFVDFSGEDLPLGALILGGDFNAPIENPATTETKPLVDFGMVRVPSTGNQWSYRYRENGGQFDGFFVRGFGDRKVTCWIPEFPETKFEQALYRDFTDHLPVFLDIAVEGAEAAVADASDSTADAVTQTAAATVESAQ